MNDFEKFQEDCRAPVDINQCHRALKALINGKYSLHVPPLINDVDIVLSRAIRELEELREQRSCER